MLRLLSKSIQQAKRGSHVPLAVRMLQAPRSWFSSAATSQANPHQDQTTSKQLKLSDLEYTEEEIREMNLPAHRRMAENAARRAAELGENYERTRGTRLETRHEFYGKGSQVTSRPFYSTYESDVFQMGNRRDYDEKLGAFDGKVRYNEKFYSQLTYLDFERDTYGVLSNRNVGKWEHFTQYAKQFDAGPNFLENLPEDTVMVAELPKNAKESTIFDALNSFGRIKSINIQVNALGEPAFAIVSFKDAASAEKARQNGDGIVLPNKHTIKIKNRTDADAEHPMNRTVVFSGIDKYVSERDILRRVADYGNPISFETVTEVMKPRLPTKSEVMDYLRQKYQNNQWLPTEIVVHRKGFAEPNRIILNDAGEEIASQIRDENVLTMNSAEKLSPEDFSAQFYKNMKTIEDSYVSKILNKRTQYQCVETEADRLHSDADKRVGNLGYCFVTYSTVDEAKRAMIEVAKNSFYGSEVKVSLKKDTTHVHWDKDYELNYLRRYKASKKMKEDAMAYMKFYQETVVQNEINEKEEEAESIEVRAGKGGYTTPAKVEKAGTLEQKEVEMGKKQRVAEFRDLMEEMFGEEARTLFTEKQYAHLSNENVMKAYLAQDKSVGRQFSTKTSQEERLRLSHLNLRGALDARLQEAKIRSSGLGENYANDLKNIIEDGTQLARGEVPKSRTPDIYEDLKKIYEYMNAPGRRSRTRTTTKKKGFRPSQAMVEHRRMEAEAIQARIAARPPKKPKEGAEGGEQPPAEAAPAAGKKPAGKKAFSTLNKPPTHILGPEDTHEALEARDRAFQTAIDLLDAWDLKGIDANGKKIVEAFQEKLRIRLDGTYTEEMKREAFPDVFSGEALKTGFWAETDIYGAQFITEADVERLRVEKERKMDPETVARLRRRDQLLKKYEEELTPEARDEIERARHAMKPFYDLVEADGIPEQAFKYNKPEGEGAPTVQEQVEALKTVDSTYGYKASKDEDGEDVVLRYLKNSNYKDLSIIKDLEKIASEETIKDLISQINPSRSYSIKDIEELVEANMHKFSNDEAAVTDFVENTSPEDLEYMMAISKGDTAEIEELARRVLNTTNLEKQKRMLKAGPHDLMKLKEGAAVPKVEEPELEDIVVDSNPEAGKA